MRFLLTTITLLLALPYLTQSNGSDMYDESYVHEIRVTFTQSDFFDILDDNYLTMTWEEGPTIYLMVSVEIDGNMVDSVGFRQKGFYSNWGSDPSLKKPFKIDFNEFVSGKKYDGLKKLNLQNGFRDPSMMRDVLSYKIMRDRDIPAPRTSYVRLYLNDEYWGVYIAVEQIDNKFLKNHFDDNDGNLFKCIDNTDLQYQGTSPIAYTDEFELKTNEDVNDWSGLISLIETFNGDESTFANDVESKFDISGFSSILAADMLFNNWDSYHDHGRNFYLYSDSTNGVFHWIPWDYNLAFWQEDVDLHFGEDVLEYPNPLSDNLFANEILTQNYYSDVCDLLTTSFSLENQEAYIDTLHDLIYTSLDEDVNKFFSIEAFDINMEEAYSSDDWGIIPGLKEFITNRSEEVLNNLLDVGFDCEPLGIIDHQTSFFKMYPNPSKGRFTITVGKQADLIEVFSMQGSLIASQSVLGVSTELDLSDANAGIYIVMVTSKLGVDSYQLMLE